MGGAIRQIFTEVCILEGLQGPVFRFSGFWFSRLFRLDPAAARQPAAHTQTDYRQTQTLTFGFLGFFLGPCNPSQTFFRGKFDGSPPQLENCFRTRPQKTSK